MKELKKTTIAEVKKKIMRLSRPFARNTAPITAKNDKDNDINYERIK